MSVHHAETLSRDRAAPSAPGGARRLAARLEPFDSYWQAPADVEAGYAKFAAYYRANYLPHLPADRAARILVVSCGPGYLVSLLREAGYTDVRRHRFRSREDRARPTPRPAVRHRRRRSPTSSAIASHSTSSSPSRN